MKTVLYLRGPVMHLESLLLAFMGEYDAVVDLVVYADDSDLHTVEGIINPDRNTLLIQGRGILGHIRTLSINMVLEEHSDADLIVVGVPGTSYKRECRHSHELLQKGVRVIWAFLGRPMTRLKGYARAVPGLEVVELIPGNRDVWAQLCGRLGIPV